MKTKDKNISSFNTVKTFRKIKENISKDIKGMSFEQLNMYLNKAVLKPTN